jgi:hypothetical protein
MMSTYIRRVLTVVPSLVLIALYGFILIGNTASAACDPGYAENEYGDCVPASVGLGEAEPFDPPSILDNTPPDWPTNLDSQGCRIGIEQWGTNASGELDCVPIQAGFDPGQFNDANSGVGCPWTGNMREYENCLAANGGGGGNTNSTGGNTNSTGGNTNSTGGNTNPGTPGKIVNPLKSQTIEQFLLAIIDIVLIFLLPLIVFFIIYGGFLLTTARGDTGQIEKGKGTLTWAVIGGVVVLGAREIIAIIKNTVDTL